MSHEQNPRTDRDSLPEIETGRYLYCAVRLDGDQTQDDTLEKRGIEDKDVSLVVVDGVGLVCHACDQIYDSGDPAQIKRWLVRHQSVVDTAGEEFGTPIPFQFDTIVRGDDARLREWLRDEHDTVERALEELAEHWEYRIEVVETEPVDETRLCEHDERLDELRTQIDDSETGTAHLLEKQYAQRVKQLRAERRESIESDLSDRLQHHAREAHSLERSASATLSSQTDEPGESTVESSDTLCRFTVLAHENDESAIGSVLDDVAANPDLAVTFTGPWPPYTFAPELGEGP